MADAERQDGGQPSAITEADVLKARDAMVYGGTADAQPKRKRRKKPSGKVYLVGKTREHLRDQGYLVEKVERWNDHAKVFQDLFGFIDVLAIRRNETLAVQVCSGGRAAGDRGEDDLGRGSDLGAHLKKITEHPNLPRVREANWRIVLHAWRKNAKGRWELRELDVS